MLRTQRPFWKDSSGGGHFQRIPFHTSYTLAVPLLAVSHESSVCCLKQILFLTVYIIYQIRSPRTNRSSLGRAGLALRTKAQSTQPHH